MTFIKIKVTQMLTNHFNLWNTEKQKIHFENEKSFYVKPRDIWFVKMGQNIGYEENGKKDFKRPVLVIKIVGNLIFTIAMTSQIKYNNRFYYLLQKPHFNDKHKHNSKNSYLILSQVKMMDKKRFIEKMGYVEQIEFKNIKEKLKALIL